MALQDDILHYAPRPPHITHLHSPTRLQVFCHDALPGLGQGVSFLDAQGQRRIGRVGAHHGQRHATIDLLSPASAAVGTPVTLHHEAAALPKTDDLRQAHFVLESEEPAVAFSFGAPRFEDLHTDLLPLETGLPLLDLLCPLTQGGTQLILDASCSRDPLLHTLTRSLTMPTLTLSAAEAFFPAALAHIRLPQHPSALVARAGLLRLSDQAPAPKALALIDLSSLWGRGPLDPEEALTTRAMITAINDILVSTTSRRLTTLIYLALGQGPAPLGLGELAETLGLGDVHTQIFVTPKGDLDPLRSRSGAQPLGAARQASARALQADLGRGQKLQEKLAIFGPDELEEEEQALLSRLSELSLKLV